MGAVAYEQDFYGWTLEQKSLLKARRLDEVDFDHLIEEVDSMGARERKELISRLRVLLMHLLKWRYEPGYPNKNSWARTIRTQRKEIYWHLKDNTSLKPEIPNAIERAYDFAVDGASDETGLPCKVFPAECPWTFGQVMDPDFWPEPAPAE